MRCVGTMLGAQQVHSWFNFGDCHSFSRDMYLFLRCVSAGSEKESADYFAQVG